jgi:phage minor structural protein
MKNADIEYLRTEPYVPTLPSYQTVVPSRKIRDQLFRIYNIETDSKNREVYVDARHIFYDLLGNVIKDYNAVDQNPQDVLNAISLDLCNEHGFNFYTNLTGTISSECALKSAVDVLLDLDTGIVPLKNAQLIRDNFDVFILQNTEIDRGMRIEYGKNMLGIKVTEDQSNVITRIIPIGKTIDSSKLKLPEVYVDSANVVNYPTPYAKAFTYDDVQVKAATETEPEVTEAQAYELLRGKVAEEYAKHCDLPEIDVDVEYVHLGDTEEYAAFKELQKVFLYDTVSAKYNPMGMEFSMQIIGYVYDAILQRFKKTKIANKLYKKNTTAFWSM